MLRKLIFLLAFFCFTAIALAQKAPSSSLDIKIQGVSNKEITTALLENISLNRFESFALSHPNQMQLLFKKSQQEITSLLQPYGYYKPTVTTKLTEQSHHYTAIFNVQLNEPLKITHLQITVTGDGQSAPFVKELLKDIPLKEGQTLTQKRYEQTKNMLTNRPFNKGFLDAKLVRSEIKINEQQYTSTVILSLNTGEQYHIGEIKYSQQRYQYANSLMQDLVSFKQGEPFTQKKIAQANKRLQDSGYFSSAQIIPFVGKRDKKDKVVPISVNTTAGYARTYSYGIGYGTFTGPRASFGTLFRHVTDTGQQFSFNASASPANTTFSTAYIFPGKDPLHNNWSITAQQDYIETDSYNERQTSFGLNRTHKYGNWQATLSVLQYLTNYSTNAAPTDANGKYFVPALSLRYDNSKEDGFWQQGFVWNNLFQVSVESPLSDRSFFGNTMSASYSFPLNKYWNRVILNANFGFIGINDIQSVAPNFRFYAGGIGNLLGYAYLSQGPTVNGQVTGGRYLGTAFIGIEQRIYGNFSTMLYYNQGNATNKLDFSDVEMLKATGIDLSYKSPLGPLMLFLSRTLGNAEHWRIDLSIGVTI